MRRGARGWLSALFLALALFVAGCASFRAPPVAPALSATERKTFNLQVFDETWALVDRHFFDPKFGGVDWAGLRPRYRPEAEAAADEEALYAVLNRMIGELKSSHIVALRPRHAHEDRVKRRAAVGLRFRKVEERWVVTEVLPDSPAAEGGVQAGWLVEACNGRPMDEAMRTPAEEGEKRTWEFRDAADAHRVVPLTARLVSMKPRREARRLEGGVLYVRFDEFSIGSRRWFAEQLKQHRAAPAAVIDLRHNPGGNAIALWLALSDVFERRVPAGTFVRRSGREWKTGSLWWFPARYPGKVAVLVDGGSASCSEIFAHAVQHHDRGAIVGRKTAGAVILSWFYSLPGGGRLQIAIQDYRALDGRRLEGNGIQPDREVTLRLADLRAGRDADVESALQVLRPAPEVRAAVAASAAVLP